VISVMPLEMSANVETRDLQQRAHTGSAVLQTDIGRPEPVKIHPVARFSYEGLARYVR